MDANTIALVQTIGIFLGLFTIWWRLSGDMKKLSDDMTNLDTKLSGEIKEVRLASEAAHKEINEKLTAIQVTQATHSERFNTVNEQFNAVKFHIKTVDDKVDQLREGK